MSWGRGPWGETPWGGEAPPEPRLRSVDTFAELPEDELGVDLDITNDLKPSFALAQGNDNLANAIVRRFITPEGFLADIDPAAADYGYDLRGKINSRLKPSELRGVISRIQAECLKDERVQSATVTGVFDVTEASATLDIQLVTAEGPHRLILAISDVTVSILNDAAATDEVQVTATAP